MDMTSNIQSTRPLSQFEEEVLEWIKKHPGMTSVDIVNAFTERPENHEDPFDLRSAAYRAVEALILEGWARSDPENHSIIHFETHLFGGSHA